MSRKNKSCSDAIVGRTKANKQQLGSNTNPNIFKGKLEGILGDQILNMKMDVRLGQLIKFAFKYKKYWESSS
jgi:hypothetical protein